MPFGVRTATPADVARLADLDRQAFGEHAYSAGTIRQLLTVFPRLVLIAETDSENPLGHAVGALGAGSETAWILALAVLPRDRRRGVGGALVLELLARARTLGARWARLTCAPGAVAPLSFYAEFGFLVVSEEADYLGAGRHRLVLERELGPSD
jgi:ribosomal-protein-alanine N-acetyltransferase